MLKHKLNNDANTLNTKKHKQEVNNDYNYVIIGKKSKKKHKKHKKDKLHEIDSNLSKNNIINHSNDDYDDDNKEGKKMEIKENKHKKLRKDNNNNNNNNYNNNDKNNYLVKDTTTIGNDIEVNKQNKQSSTKSSSSSSLLFNTLNPSNQIREVKNNISNLKSVLSWIPWGTSTVPDSIASQQTDADISLLCKFNEKSLLKQYEIANQRLFLLEQNALKTASEGKIHFYLYTFIMQYYYVFFF
jgi:hypothetical protein